MQYDVEGAHVKLIGRRLFLINTQTTVADETALAKLVELVVEQYGASRTAHALTLARYTPIIANGRINVAEIITITDNAVVLSFEVPRWYHEFAKNAFDVIKNVNMFVIHFSKPISAPT